MMRIPAMSCSLHRSSDANAGRVSEVYPTILKESHNSELQVQTCMNSDGRILILRLPGSGATKSSSELQDEQSSGNRRQSADYGLLLGLRTCDRRLRRRAAGGGSAYLLHLLIHLNWVAAKSTSNFNHQKTGRIGTVEMVVRSTYIYM